MTVRIEPSWNRALAAEWDAPYFKLLTEFVRQEYRTRQVFPPGRQIFAAFDAAPFDKVKVVILGQDPYHGIGQADENLRLNRDYDENRDGSFDVILRAVVKKHLTTQRCFNTFVINELCFLA